MKTMLWHPSHQQNGFVATQALGYIIYVIYTEHLYCIQRKPVAKVLFYIYICFIYIYIYIYIYLHLRVICIYVFV